MSFLEVMNQRGMVAQVTHEDELAEHLTAPRTAYAGFDPTANSLHIGHLIPVLALRRWQQAGHRAICLMGGGTALVGDPTGKSEMRQMLTEETIEQNIERFKSQVAHLLDLGDVNKGVVVNNADWLKGIEYLPFLRDIGVHFSVNRMLSAECFKSRLEKGLSFLEFNYMLLQSYDFYHLHEQFQCSVQLGGDDQWSNMLGGMELIRRKVQQPAFCLTVPLLVTPQGTKMGKTEKGAVWIDPNLTSPYEFFQFFRNVDDAMVEQCLFYFTDLDASTVKSLAAKQGQAINEAKVELAYEATRLIHGEEEAKKAKQAASSLFNTSAAGGDAPEHTIASADFGDSLNVIDALVLSKIQGSKSDARRLIQQGGLQIDGEKVDDIKYEISSSSVLSADGILIRCGKKRYYRLRIS